MKNSTSFYRLIFTVLLLLIFFKGNAQQIFASSQRSGATGLLCVGCVVTNAANAADGNLQTFSTLNVPVGVAAATYQELIFPASVASGTPVSFKLGTANNLVDLTLLGGISIQPFNGTTPAGNAVLASTLVSVLTSNNQLELSITPAQKYDRIRVTLNGGLVGALSSIYLYEAFYKASGAVACNSAFDEIHGISSALLNLGLNIGGVVNPQNAIDGNLNTAATLNAGVGVVGAYAQETIIFESLSTIGDSVRLTLALPPALLSAGVLANISLSTYSGNTSNNDTQVLNSSLISLRLLDLSNNLQKVQVTYAPAKVFDRVQLRLGGGIANLLSTLNLYEAQKIIAQPVVKVGGVVTANAQICAGSTATLVATSTLNTSFTWYTAATGGTPVFTGASFTTPVLMANTVYYVAANRTGCTDQSARTSVAITVNQIPAAPVIANTNITVCPGGTATFTAQTITGIAVKWYTTATGGTPIFTGNTYTTAAISQTTKFYAEAVAGGTCTSISRTPVTATLGTVPAAPALTATNTTICTGSVAVLSIQSPVNGIVYNWYSAAAGGTPLYTGVNFTTPALSANTNYYAEAANAAGCVSVTRAKASVIVTPVPANPVLTANSLSITSGQTASITVSNAQTGISYKWYTSATAATPIFTGTNYLTPALFTTTSYFVAGVNSTGCLSASRTEVTINVINNANAPCTFANSQASSVSNLCIGCSIVNNALAVDADTTTASTINVVAGVLASASQTLQFQQPGFKGDTVKLVVQTPVALVSAAVLGNISVALYNGAILVGNYPLNNSLIKLSLLSGANRYAIYVPAAGNYDRVTLTLNSGVATLLTSLQLFYAAQQYPPAVLNPVAPEICSGSTASINITAPANGTFKWYTAPTGGSPVFTGTSFTTPVLTAGTTYYIEYSRNGCTAVTRKPVKITVDSPPVKPVVAPVSASITSGQTATFKATTLNNATVSWYTSPTGGTPVFNGYAFTTPALTANTTYYAQAVLGGCVSPDRTVVPVTVTPVVLPSVAVSPATQTINAGTTATLTATSTTPGAIFNWYTTPTGGTSIFTGAVFTTPAVFTNTTYYASATITSTGAVSATRASGAITVNALSSNPVPCDAAIAQTNTTSGLLCVLCGIANPGGSVDNNSNTFSQLTTPVGLVGGYSQQTLQFANPGIAGDSVVVELGIPGALASVGVLSQISLATYNGSTYNNDRFSLNGSLINVTLLSGTSTFRVAFKAASAFDRVEIRLNSGVAGVLNALNVYYAAQEVAAPLISVPNTTACSGSPVTLTATVPANTTVKWYTSATGGTTVFTGASFTTPALTSTTTYYAEATRTADGCVQTVRTPSKITITTPPVKPVISPASASINSGQTATFTATTLNNATVKWYTTATGGTAVFTGYTFTTPALSANTTYYAESVSGNCVSPDRTAVPVTINQVIVLPTVAVNPATQAVNAGTTATLTATSTTPGAIFNWYTTPTGGTSIFTGAVFTTPAVFTNTTYYASATITSTGAVSATRASGAITVNAVSSNPVPCDAAIAQTNTTSGLLCVLCGIANPGGSVDNNSNTFSQLTTPVGLVGGYSQQTLQFANPGIAGDSVVVELGIPGALASVGVLSQISLATYNGSTYNNDRFSLNGSLINVTLLSGTSTFRVAFKAGSAFDRVEIRLNSGVAGVLNALNVYYAAQEVAAPLISAASITACQGTQATLTATVPANTTVKWYTSATGGTPVFTGAVFNTPVLNGTVTYYAEASRTTDGCTQTVRTPVKVNVTPLPVAPVVNTPTATVCSGQPATFTATNVSGVTFAWYNTPAGGTPVFTGNPFVTAALNATTSYYVAALSAGSCGSSTRTMLTANVTATPLVPVVSQTPVQTCSGSSAVLVATSTQPGVIFNWYTAATGGTPVFTGPQFTTPVLTANTSYYVDASSGTCTSSTRAKADVTVNPTTATPTFTVNPSNAQIVSGQTVTVTAASSTPGVTFKWYTTANGGTPIFTGAIFTSPALTSNTTYYIESSLTATGCINALRAKVNITVNPIFSTSCDFASAQTVDINGGLACVLCAVTNPNNAVDADTTSFSQVNLPVSVLGSYIGQSLIFGDTGNAGDTVTVKIGLPVSVLSAGVLSRLQIASFNGAVYNGDRVSLSSNLISIRLLSGNTVAQIKFVPKGTFDRVEVRLLSAVASVFNSVNIFYASKQVGIPTLTASTVNICSGGTAVFTVSNPKADVTYKWYTSAVGGSPVFTGTSFTTPALAATTTYYVESSRTSNGCANPNRVAASANVTPSPVNPVLAQNNVSVCAGDNATLTVTNANGATVKWYNAATNGTLLFTGATYTVSPLTTTIYYAELSNATCVSPARTKATVTVNPRPVQPGLQSNNVQVCAGSSATLQVLTPVTGVSYNWYTAATGGTPVFTGAIFNTPAITQNTTYFVEAANNTTGCTDVNGRIAVNIEVSGVVSAPTLSAATSQVCSGGSVTLSVINPAAGLTYNWYTTATGGTPIFTGVTYTSTNLTANAAYFVSAVSSSGCVSATRTETDVTVLPIPSAPVVNVPAGGLNSCSGSTITLSVTSPQANLVYRWYAAATGGTPVFTGSLFTTPALTATTTYYVEASSAGNCNASTRTPVTINVNPVPPAPTVASNSVSVCTGNTATLSVSSPQAGVIYQWYDSVNKTNLLFTGVTYVTGPISAVTAFYVSAQNSQGCSSSSLTQVQVTIQAPPSVPVIANGSAVQSCSGSVITLSISNPQAGLVYNWYTAATGGIPVFTGTSFTTPALTATATYFAEAVNSTGCASSSRTGVTININALPTAPVITDQAGSSSPTVCAGSFAVLTATSTTPNVSFQWYTAATGGTPVFTGATFTTPAITATTIYYAEAISNAGGCASSTRTPVTITVSPTPATPTVTASNVSVCLGSSATLSVSAPQGGIVYNWYDSVTKNNLLFTGTTFITAPITAAANFYVSARNSTGCSSAGLAQVAVNIQAPPATPVIANGSTVQSCTGSVVTLNVANAQANITYNWYAAATGGTPVFTGASFTTSILTSNTTYFVEAVSSTGCASSSRTRVDININAVPIAPTITDNAGSSTPKVCPGSSAILTATSTTANVSFNWYTVATGGTPIFTGATFTTPAITATTTYYAEAISNASGCASSTRTPVQITTGNTTAPQPLVNTTIFNICPGTSTTITVTNPDPNTTYKFYASATGGSPIFTGTNFNTPIANASAIYYLEAVNAAYCSPSARLAINVNVLPQPSVPVLSSASVAVCPGAQATLSIASPQPGITYNWYDSATKNNLLFTGANFVTPAISTNTAYFVEATNGSCANPTLATAQVSVTAQPNTPMLSSNSVNNCAGTQAVLSIANPQSGITYNWYTAATGGSSVFTGTSFVTPVLASNVTYYAEAVNSTGCPSAMRVAAAITVTSGPSAPQISSAGTSICPGSSTTLAAVADANITISWYANPSGGTALFTGNNFTTPVLSVNTTYYAEASNANGCTAADRTPVTVTIIQPLDAPVVSVSSTTSSSVTFAWGAVTNATGYLVSFDNGQTFTSPASGSAGLTDVVTGLQPNQAVTIVVRATGASDCQQSANSLAVTGTAGNPLGDGIYIPNAFTPNGDGNNDIFLVYGNNIKGLNLSVYDQWGELQYRGTNRANGWDGTYKGKGQPVGVYVYYVEATMNDGQVIKKKGTITLLR